jgi:hypothetical protein
MAAMFGHARTAISCMWKPEILYTKHCYRKACNVGATPCPEHVFHELKCSRAIIWQTDLKVLRNGVLERVVALKVKGSHVVVSEAQQWPDPQNMKKK